MGRSLRLQCSLKIQTNLVALKTKKKNQLKIVFDTDMLVKTPFGWEVVLEFEPKNYQHSLYTPPKLVKNSLCTDMCV